MAMASSLAARCSAGLEMGPPALKPKVPLKTAFRDILQGPLPSFMESMQDIAHASVIAEVLEYAEMTEQLRGPPVGS